MELCITFAHELFAPFVNETNILHEVHFISHSRSMDGVHYEPPSPSPYAYVTLVDMFWFKKFLLSSLVFGIFISQVSCNTTSTHYLITHRFSFFF